MSKLLEGKVAVITGAGRGIGQATAELYAKHGAKIVIADIDAGPANETLELVKKAGSDGVVVTGNICKREDCDRIIKAGMDLGGGSIDILANVAGITRDAVIHKMTEAEWDFVIEVNLKGTYNMIQASVPAMRDVAKDETAARSRSIINVSSTSGVKGNAGQINYAAAKAGINGMTRTVAKEWARFNIRCNSIAPGFIETRLTSGPSDDPKLGVPEQQMQMIKMLYSQTGLQRPEGMGKPIDIANLALFFASDLSSYVSGQVLVAAGAMIDSY
ncbi:MAG: SDR family NAD(P)-dependent oxidoreductase [Cyanobacteria bacterium]|nr:SDR family NAD(P)-dependent oxidoreductase [Cyanobacteriota bacterium]MDA1020577.1 SDR family NAD(P)-dependent oxidoreductase [Cyanobacteriota bacterium]